MHFMIFFRGNSQSLFPRKKAQQAREKATLRLFSRFEELSGITSVHTNGVKVLRYLYPSIVKVKAMPQLPKEHLFFHRSLSEIFPLGFQAEFVIDDFEERTFPSENITEHNGWHLLTEIPVIIAIRQIGFVQNSIISLL